MEEFASLAFAIDPASIALVIVLSGRTTVPVNVGDASGALRLRAVCVAVDIGLRASVVLSTLARPTIVLSIPVTVPVNAGEASGAFVPRAVVIVVV